MAPAWPEQSAPAATPAPTPQASTASSAPVARPEASPAAAHRLDILVAEDNEVNQLVFTQILQGLGCTFEIVGDGRQAVEAWRRHRPSPILSAMEAIDSEHARENEVMREVDVEGQTARIPSLPVQVVSAGGRSAQEGTLSTPPLGADAKSVFEELGLASLASKDA